MFEPLIGKKSIQYANGPGGRKRRQLMDRSFSHEAVKDYYEHFVAVNMNEKKAEEVKQLFSSGRVFLCDLILYVIRVGYISREKEAYALLA